MSKSYKIAYIQSMNIFSQLKCIVKDERIFKIRSKKQKFISPVSSI